MSPVSPVFHTIETVRFSLNTIGNKHTQSREKDVLVRHYLGIKTWDKEVNKKQNKVGTLFDFFNK